MSSIHSRLLGTVAVTGLLSLGSSAVLADGPAAIAAAVQHAGLAANSDDIGGVQRHLHHVLNCLVGPDGEGFDASAGNPCANAGGAIPQTADAAMREKLMHVADEIREGVMAQDIADAKHVAMSAQEMLADE